METKFWNRMQQLCQENNTTPTAVAKEIGLSNSISVRWKQGSIPNKATLQKIADYFKTTTDYLLGYDKSSTSALKSELYRQIDGLTDEQAKEIQSYVDFLLSKKKEDKK